MNCGEPLLEYAALGDSLSVGAGTMLFDPGFVEYYLQMSRNALQKRIKLYKFAKSGATTKDVLNMIQHPCVADAIRHADIITITAGGNDLIRAALTFLKEQNEDALFDAQFACTDNLSRILNAIDALVLEEEGPYIVRLVNLYNPFPGLPQAKEWIERFNTHIESFSDMRNLKVANIYDVFKGNEDRLLAADGIHPNGKGYYLMAEEMRKLGYESL